MRKTLLFGASAGLLAVLVGCGYSESEMQAQRDRVSQLEGQLRDAQSSLDEAQNQLTDLRGRNEAMAARLRDMGVNVEQLESDLEGLRARERAAQERLATFRNMLSRFRSMIDSGQLSVRISRGRMVVELQEDILFDSGEADLKDAGQQALTQVAQVLNTIENRNFQIAGHTDNVPIHSRRFPSNWELSTKRAVNVAKYLIEQGMDASRLSAAGYADTEPMADNSTPEGRRKNRRIEIVLVPNLDELPDLSALENATSS